MYVNYWKLVVLSERLLVDECLCSNISTGQELVSWCVIGCRCLLAGASLAVAGIVDCITLETRQGWLRMLACHTALYREAVFTVRVAGTVSVVATQCKHIICVTYSSCLWLSYNHHGFSLVFEMGYMAFRMHEVIPYNYMHWVETTFLCTSGVWTKGSSIYFPVNYQICSIVLKLCYKGDNLGWTKRKSRTRR